MKIALRKNNYGFRLQNIQRNLIDFLDILQNFIIEN